MLYDRENRTIIYYQMKNYSEVGKTAEHYFCLLYAFTRFIWHWNTTLLAYFVIVLVFGELFIGAGLTGQQVTLLRAVTTSSPALTINPPLACVRHCAQKGVKLRMLGFESSRHAELSLEPNYPHPRLCHLYRMSDYIYFFRAQLYHQVIF